MAKLKSIAFTVLLFAAIATFLPQSEAFAAGASISFSLAKDMSSMSLSITSSIAVHGVQIKMIIPSNLSVGEASLSGFLRGSEHMALQNEHRWFNLSADGTTAASMSIPITTTPDKNTTVTLIGVDLKDASGSKIQVDTPLPIALEVVPTIQTVPKPLHISHSAVSAYLDPSSQRVEAGQECRFSIRIEQTDMTMSGARVSLTFNPAAMQVSDVKPGEIFGKNPVVGVYLIDNVVGRIDYGILKSTGETTSNNNTIATIRAVVNADATEGESILSLTTVDILNEHLDKIAGIVFGNSVINVVTTSQGTVHSRVSDLRKVWIGVGLGITVAAALSLTILLRRRKKRTM